MEAWERVSKLMQHFNLNKNQFSKEIQAGNNVTVGRIVNERRNPSSRTVDLILKRFPQINRDWLLYGNGEMINQDYEPRFSNAEELGIHEDLPVELSVTRSGSEFAEFPDGHVLMTIPLIDSFAYAGYLSSWNDPVFIEELPKHSIVVEKRHKGKYRAFKVRGDSMDNDRRNAICDGDIVVGRNIEPFLWQNKFHLHKYETYVVVHKEGILIKDITEHDVENGIITCHSLNEDKAAYPDFDVPLAEVLEIYNVVSVERRRRI